MNYVLPLVTFFVILISKASFFLLPLLGAITLYLLLDLNESKKKLRELEAHLETMGEQLNSLSPEAKSPVKSEVSISQPEQPKVTPERNAVIENTKPVASPPPPKQEIKIPEKPVLQEKVKPQEAPVNAPLPPSSRPTSERHSFDIIRFFSTGNVFAKVGSVILFFGFAFLIKLVSDAGLFPIESRMICSAVGANILIAIGWRLRKKVLSYGLILQGTGFGIFYLTVFGSFRLCSLLSPKSAFVMLIAATVIFVLLSILQNALSLAILAVSGGFLAPILTSTGSGNYIGLFTYYAILNLGILVIAKYKPWRELNLVGFIFTYAVGGIWGSKYYEPAFFTNVEFFVVLHFFIYTAVVLLFSRLSFKLSKEMVVDGVLVFGVPLFTFLYQAALLKDTRFGIALSCAILGGIYVFLATFLFRKKSQERVALTQAFVGSGITFSTLAVPYTLSHIWTGSVWAIEGALLVWFGIKQEKPKIRIVGYCLNLIGLCSFFAKTIDFQSINRILNPPLFGSLIFCVSALFVGYLIFKNLSKSTEQEKPLMTFFVGLAFFWWFSALIRESIVWYASDFFSVLMGMGLLIAGVSAFLFYILARLLAWSALSLIRYPFLLLVSWYWFRGMYGSHENSLYFVNPFYLGSLISSLAGGFIALGLFKAKGIAFDSEKKVGWCFLLLGYLVLFGSTQSELIRFYEKWEPNDFSGGMNLWVTISAGFVAGYYALSRWLKCPELAAISYGLPVLGLVTLLTQLKYQQQPFEKYGLVAWMAVFIVLYLQLFHFEKKEKIFLRYFHFTGLWLLAAVILWYLFRVTGLTVNESSVWKWSMMLGVIGANILGVVYYPEGLFPFGKNKKAYISSGVTPLVILLVVAAQLLNVFNSGNSDPLPYIPVINPLEVLLGFAFVVTVLWFKKARTLEPLFQENIKLVLSFFGLFGFLWFTMGIIRAVHHLGAVPWNSHSLFSSRAVQTALSVGWGLLSLLTMIISNRKGSRTMWVVGTCLICVVVGKLVLIDLSGRSTLEGVISCIATGVLLLATGYFAPIPPKKGNTK